MKIVKIKKVKKIKIQSKEEIKLIEKNLKKEE